MNQMATQISRIQQLKDAGRIGGKKFVALYGNPGTSIGRSMGGKNSWEKRKADPALYKKYANVPILPKESEHLAEFFGIILGDGNITRFQCAVYLNSKTDQKYSKFIVGLIKQLFGLNATISKHKADNVLRIVVSSADLVRFLLKNGLVLGNKVRQQAKVPSWILADKKYVRACLRGLMDTDGCLAWHNYVVNGKRYSYPKVIS